MHEASLAMSLIDLVDEVVAKEGATKATAIQLELGALSCVEPEALLQAFAAATVGTRSEGCTVALTRTPGRAYCAGCGGDVTLSQRGEACPSCGGHRLLVTQGDQMRLLAVEVI